MQLLKDFRDLLMVHINLYNGINDKETQQALRMRNSYTLKKPTHGIKFESVK